MNAHEPTEVVVIGGGVTGASVTYWLARAGVRVTCIERTFPAAGASGASFSVDISSRKTPKPFFDLSVAAAAAHVSLEQDLGPAPWRHATVTLEWGGSSRERTVVRERVQRLKTWRYPAELVDRESAERLAPGVRFPHDHDDRVAVYRDQAWYDAVILTQLLLWHAQRHGARVVVGENVDRIDVPGGSVQGVATGGGRRFPADIVVNCAGPEAAAIAQLAGASLPLVQVPGLVALAPAHATTLDVIVMAPGINVRPAGDDSLKLHSYDADALLQRDAPDAVAAREVLRRRADSLLRTPVKLNRTYIGVRPIPPDGLPMVGGPLNGVDGLYAIVTHSAAHLAPLLGRLAAEELTGTSTALLDPFRPQRFDGRATTAITAKDESFRETQMLLANHATHVGERLDVAL